MNSVTRTLLLASLALTWTPGAQGAPMRYQGMLSDRGQPANGSFDLQLTLYSAAQGEARLGSPVGFENVEVVNGQFQVELEAPAAAQNASAWLEVAVREGHLGGAYTRIDGREKVILEPQISTCWSTTGDTGSNPAVNFLGNTDNQTLVLSSPFGVRINQPGQLSGGTDLAVHARTTSGDADADINLISRTGKVGAVYVRDTGGNLVLAASVGATVEVFSGLDSATQNDGRPVVAIDGRLRSLAVGTGATDVSGGIWLDDEVAQRAYLGRGNNSQNWTGVFTGSGWRFAAHDDGLVTINTTQETLSGADLVLAARPVGGDADSDLVFTTRNGKNGRVYLNDTDGSFRMNALSLTAGSAYLTMGNSAFLSNGGVWTNASSRALKEGFAAVDPAAMLRQVLSLPISTWTYKSSTEGTHIGPMAEDFKAAFGLSGDGKTIATVDADGVALAAIQGLNAKLESENQALRAHLARIEARLEALQAQR